MNNMPVMMKKVYELAESFDKQLLATAFSRTVIVNHADGSSCRWEDALMYRLTHPDFLYEPEKQILEQWNAFDSGLIGGLEGDIPETPRSEIGWLIVFTEHQGFHVFRCNDLSEYRQYQRIHEIEEFPV